MLELGKMRSLYDVARRLLWWKKEEQWFQDEARLIAQIMVFGDLEDTRAMLRVYPAERLKAVLDDPPRGVFTPQAWNFWNLYLGKELRSLPKRSFRSGDKQDH
mgnify:CR=1 FL=1